MMTDPFNQYALELAIPICGLIGSVRQLASENPNNARPALLITAIQKTFTKPSRPDIEVIDQFAAASGIQK
jgi:hypothetical protein